MIDANIDNKKAIEIIEYIRRADAIDAFEDTTFTKNEIRRRLLDIKPADVAPVVHSRWIKYTGMGKVQWMCEKCSAEEKNPKVANYCYHCGAKMDG